MLKAVLGFIFKIPAFVTTSRELEQKAGISSSTLQTRKLRLDEEKLVQGWRTGKGGWQVEGPSKQGTRLVRLWALNYLLIHSPNVK